MAEATSTGGCNPLETKQVNPGKPVGSDWTEIVQDLLKNGAKRAQEHLETQDEAGEGAVVVRVAMSAFLRFPYKGKELSAEGIMNCACTNDGSVCICYGACDFDACCDVAAGPIVAME